MQKGVAVPALRERMIRNKLKDAWWLAQDDVPYESPMRLRQIEDVLRDNDDAEFFVMHSESADRGEIEWQPVYLTPKLRTKEAEKPQASSDVPELLLKRLDTLEANQHVLLEAISGLTKAVEASLEASPAGRAAMQHTLDATAERAGKESDRMRQIREKLNDASIRLVS